MRPPTLARGIEDKALQTPLLDLALIRGFVFHPHSQCGRMDPRIVRTVDIVFL